MARQVVVKQRSDALPLLAGKPVAPQFTAAAASLTHTHTPATRRIATGVAVMGAAAAAVLLLVRGVKRRSRVPLGGEAAEAYDPLQRWLTSPVIKTRS